MLRREGLYHSHIQKWRVAREKGVLNALSEKPGGRPAEAFAALSMRPGEFTSLAGTLDRFETAGMGLVEMVLADGDSWDRYVASQWWTVTRWLEANGDHPDAPQMRRYLDDTRRSHLATSAGVCSSYGRHDGRPQSPVCPGRR